MAAEQPTLTRRSRFGSSCAIATAVVCLVYAIAGCLNPLTDDTPSAAPTTVARGPEDPAGSQNPPPGAPAQGGQFPDDLLTEPGNGSPNPPASNPTPSGGTPDAGLVDAGPDSGSMEPSP